LISILHSELKKNKLIANHIFLMKDLPPDHKKKILGPVPAAKGGKTNPNPPPVVEVAPEPVKEVIPSVEAKIWME
jgi:hypothetical protein